MAGLHFRNVLIFYAVVGSTWSQYVEQQPFFGIAINSQTALPQPTINFHDVNPGSPSNYSSPYPPSYNGNYFPEQHHHLIAYPFQQYSGQQVQYSVAQASVAYQPTESQPQFPTNQLPYYPSYQPNPFHPPYLNQGPYQSVPQPFYNPAQQMQFNYPPPNVSSSYPTQHASSQLAFFPHQGYAQQPFMMQSFTPVQLSNSVPSSALSATFVQPQLAPNQYQPLPSQNQQVTSQSQQVPVQNQQVSAQEQVSGNPTVPLTQASSVLQRVPEAAAPVAIAGTPDPNSVIPDPKNKAAIPPTQPYQVNKPHYQILGTPSNLFLSINNNSSVPVYSGLIIDLLDALSNQAGFVYSFGVIPDQQYGSQAADGSWNGLIRSLIDGKCDIAAADLSITSDRESVVDFTIPFYQYSMAMIVNKQHVNTGNGATYLIRNNADAYLLKYSPVPQHKAIWENITRNFPNSYVENENEGIQKVLNGPFAFIMESPAVNQALSISGGQLEKSPLAFPSGHLAFAVRQGSPLREMLSLAIIRLHENGQLKSIINKYLTIAA